MKTRSRVFVMVVTMIMAIVISLIALTGCAQTFQASKNINTVAREDGSGTKSAFMEIIGLKGKADVSGVIVATGTAAVLAEVKGNPYAIAYESLGYVTDEVKILRVNGVMPTIENIKNNTYKIARPLNVVYKDASVESGVNQAFLQFLNSSQAQEIISADGYVSTKDGAITYTATASLSGSIGISGSTSLQPLMMKLADAFEELQPNVSITVSGGGSGTGYANGENGTSDFGMISENFAQQKAPSCRYYEVAKDGIAIIVNKKNTYDNITMEQLKNVYNVEQEASTKIVKWNDLNN